MKNRAKQKRGIVVRILTGDKLKTLAIMCIGASLLMMAPKLAAQEIRHAPGGYITVNGGKLWYESEGTGEPLILIAGGPGSSHVQFHNHFSVLADKFRVIYFDSFGRGKSDRAKSTSEYTLARDVDDVEGLRKALGLGKINLLGHSYGGVVAQAYALKYPSSLKKVIFSCTLYSAEMWQANNDSSNYEIRQQYPEVWAKLMDLRARGLHSKDNDHRILYNTVPMGLFYFYDASNAAKFPQDSLSLNPDVYYQIAGDDADFLIGGDIARIDFRTQLKGLSMPVLIIAGRFDRISIPKYSTLYKQYAPQAEFVMFEKSGHFPYVEEEDSYFSTVRKFLMK